MRLAIKLKSLSMLIKGPTPPTTNKEKISIGLSIVFIFVPSERVGTCGNVQGS